MSLFATVSDPAPLRTANIHTISLLYAGIVLVMALTQLYSFTEMLAIIQSFWLPGGRVVASMVAGGIVIAEVLALPFLLRMRMSTFARVISMVMGWVVAGAWVVLSVWLIVTTNAVTNIGMLGDVIVINPGTGTLMVGLALAVLAAWASWGMWPVKDKKK